MNVSKTESWNNMDFKSNNRYFHRSYKMLYAGLPLAIIGGVVVFGKFFRWYIHVQNAFTVMFAVGIMLVLFFLVSFPRDGEFDRGIKNKIRDIRATAEQKITALEHTPHFGDNYLAEGFAYGEGTCELKRGSDGIFRTDIYSAAQLIITVKRLYVYSMRFSTVKDETETDFAAIEFDSIQDVSIKEELIEVTYGKKHGAVRCAFFCIKTDEKEYSFITHADSLADTMAKKILLRKS